MHKEKLIITLPQPCSEDWELMSPADRGRFCASCQKTVIDFTRMNDEEIIKFLHKQKDEHHCGHFHYTQLGREITEPQKPLAFSLLKGKIAASLLFFQTIGSVAYAQVAKQRVHHQHKTPAKPIDKRRGIRGYVRDNHTNNPLVNMKVFITDTTISCITDKHGYFFLPLPDTMQHTTVQVQAKYTELSEKMPPETTIPYEEVKLDTLTTSSILTLYRCTIEVNKEVVILSHRPPQTFGGLPVIRSIPAEEIPKRRFWPFHRKHKKKNEE